MPAMDNLLKYMCAKNYQNRAWSDKVIAKIKWCSFFDSHNGTAFVATRPPDTLPGLWWFGVVVSALASINEVNQRRARLVLRWVTVSGFNSLCGTFILRI